MSRDPTTPVQSYSARARLGELSAALPVGSRARNGYVLRGEPSAAEQCAKEAVR